MVIEIATENYLKNKILKNNRWLFTVVVNEGVRASVTPTEGEIITTTYTRNTYATKYNSFDN